MPRWTKATLAIKGLHAAAVALVIAVLLAITLVQTVRIEGFKVWPISVEGWKPKALACEQTIANIRVAQDLADAWAKAARLGQEARYRAIAERTDHVAQEETAAALGDAERFIAAGGHARLGAGGLRPKADRSEGRPAGTGASDRSAEDHQGAGPSAELDGAEGPLVAVTPEDVRICTINTVKAEAAREWALALEAASAPEREVE